MNSLSLVLLTEYYQSPFVQQVVPLFVMELFSLPGAPGLFLAACTAASLRWGIEFIVFNSFSTLTTKKTLLDFWHFAMGLYWRPADYSNKGSVIQKAFPCHDIILVWFKKIINVLMTPDILSIPIICYHYKEFIQQTWFTIYEYKRWLQKQSNIHNNHDDVPKWKHFPLTGHLCGEFTGHRWIPHTKASDAKLWCWFWSAPEWTAK